jgi:hypothetical protein
MNSLIPETGVKVYGMTYTGSVQCCVWDIASELWKFRSDNWGLKPNIDIT